MALGPGVMVAVANISTDPVAALRMRGIVTVSEGKPLGCSEMRFDEVQPRGVRRSEDGMNPEAAKQLEKARVIVDVRQVVQNDMEPAVRIAPPKESESTRDCRRLQWLRGWSHGQTNPVFS